MEEQDDQSIVETVLNGNKQAYAHIVRRYQNKLYGLFRKMGSTEGDAEDLTQETLLKAYRKLASHRSDKSFAGWIYAIAVNLQRDRGKRTSLEMAAGREPAEAEVKTETPESRLLQKELRSELDKLLETLPAHYRLLLLLRYTNQLSYSEIADITELSVRQVTNVIHRAKLSLRKTVRAKEGPHNDKLGFYPQKQGRS